MVLKKFNHFNKNQSDDEASETSNTIIDTVLEGKTLQVYWYLITNGVKGVRDIQKDLNFSSSSIAYYHLRKLMDNNVVVKFEDTDKYMLNEEIKTGILSLYIRVGFRMIPRLTLYLGINLIGFILFIGLLLIQGIEVLFQPLIFLSFVYLLFSTIAFIYESRNITKLKP